MTDVNHILILPVDPGNHNIFSSLLEDFWEKSYHLMLYSSNSAQYFDT